MKKYDVRCPLCGKVNKDLYLDETEGWMECDGCGHCVRVLTPGAFKRIRIFTGKELVRVATANPV